MFVGPIHIVNVIRTGKRQHLSPHVQRLAVDAGDRGSELAWLVRVESLRFKPTQQQKIEPGLCDPFLESGVRA
jgi:hypothetical protein